MSTPTLSTERTVLVPLRSSDVDNVLDLYSEPTALRHIGGFRETPEVQQRAFLHAKQAQNADDTWASFWTVRNKEVGAFLGTASLNKHPSSEHPQIGGILRRSTWRNGLATEVGQCLVSYVLQDVGLDAVYAITEADNDAAQSLAERLGFECTGRETDGDIVRVVYRCDEG